MMMRIKKPELIDVRVIAWDRERGLFGILTVYDDGVVEREAWGDLIYTELTVAFRRKDIRRVFAPRRYTS
jgi:hypothetical protein